MWSVQPRYGVARRVLFPVYGRDQLLAWSLLVVLLIGIAVFDAELALYIGVGAYIGGVLMMNLSTPASLLLPAACEQNLVQLLDDAPALERIANGEAWVPRGGRLKRWASDTVRLRQTTEGLLVTGRTFDLRQIAQQLKS